MRVPFARPSLIACLLLALAVSSGVAQARRTGPARTEPIDMIVIHSTGGPTCDPRSNRLIWVPAGRLREDVREIEAHPKLGVHYMIDRDGTVVASVPEDRVAYHVFGFSSRSIGIELVNDGDGRDPFPPAQITALVDLLRDIVRRRGIRREGIKRHSDLDHAMLPCAPAQRRKVDPGDAFAYREVLDRVFAAQRAP
jgi:N-acetylmuramoyl-L-alanine amidase